MKEVFPLLLALLILIGSVGYLISRTDTTDSPETTTSSMANVPEQESSSAPAEDFKSEDSCSTTDTAEKESTGNLESETSVQNETESPQAKDHVTGSIQPTDPAPTQPPSASEKEPPKQTEPPRQPEPPKETQPPAQPEPPVTTPPTQPPAPPPEETPTDPVVTEPEETEPPETEPEEPKATEPEFDIGYWIGYAKSYAVSAGLRPEPTAVDCWDNPVRAGNHCTYLERDIQSRLNRYAKDEEITDVWIWAESRGDGTYDLYIGYA